MPSIPCLPKRLLCKSLRKDGRLFELRSDFEISRSFAANPFGNGTMTKQTGTLSEIACVRARSRIANANRVFRKRWGVLVVRFQRRTNVTTCIRVHALKYISTRSTNVRIFTAVHRRKETRVYAESWCKEDGTLGDTELTWRNNVPWNQTEFPRTPIRVCLCGSRAYTRHNCTAAINN